MTRKYRPFITFLTLQYFVSLILMRRDSLSNRNAFLFGAASLAAHTTLRNEGFRQRDLKFFVILLGNWLEYEPLDPLKDPSNIQISRHIEFLCSSGFAEVMKRKTRGSRYTLTRLGMLEILGNFFSTARANTFSRIIFIHFFLRAYGANINALIANDKRTFSPSVALELRALLDHRAFLEDRIRSFRLSLNKLRERIRDTADMVDFAKNISRLPLSYEDWAQKLEERSPYQLNSKKPLSELVTDLGEQHARWELTEGSKLRNDLVWSPIARIFEAELKVMQELLEYQAN